MNVMTNLVELTNDQIKALESAGMRPKLVRTEQILAGERLSNDEISVPLYYDRARQTVLKAYADQKLPDTDAYRFYSLHYGQPIKTSDGDKVYAFVSVAHYKLRD